ncbi:hypothetical protein ACFV24_21850 [Nocardia fluminea]|uniref:hypothetical protein n=1 Tax=Nocardia fluminea TaxID=134984 RepID=UPI00366D7D96
MFFNRAAVSAAEAESGCLAPELTISTVRPLFWSNSAGFILATIPPTSSGSKTMTSKSSRLPTRVKTLDFTRLINEPSEIIHISSRADR